MNTKILEYSNRYEVIVSDEILVDENGNLIVWFEGTWGKDNYMTPEKIKKEAELLAEDLKNKKTEVPKELKIK